MLYKIQVVIIAILSFIDFLITKAIVGENISLELNPVMAYVISNYGYFGVFAFKAGLIILLFITVAKLKQKSKFIEYLLNILILIYLAVITPGLLILI